MHFCILPAGAWGTALAIHLSRAGHTVTLVPHTLEEAMDMGDHRENRRFFPGHAFPRDLQIGFEIKPALMEAFKQRGIRVRYSVTSGEPRLSLESMSPTLVDPVDIFFLSQEPGGKLTMRPWAK